MRSSAVGPDRAVDRSSAPPPRAANLYACHEVMGATACRPFRVIRVDIAESAFSSAIENTRHHPTESWSADLDRLGRQDKSDDVAPGRRARKCLSAHCFG
jgi:hypothetical protein